MSNDRRVSPVFSICEARKAKVQLDKLAAQHSRFTELWEDGVCWLLQRDPARVGTLVAGHDATYLLVTTDFLAIQLPVILVVYSITDAAKRIVEVVEVVELVAVTAAKSNDNDASAKGA